MRSFDVVVEIYKSSNDDLTSAEISILLKFFKNDFIWSLNLELDDFREERKQGKIEEPLLIFCTNYRKNHFLGKCPLIDFKVYKICKEGHSTKHYPSLPG